MNSAWKNKNLQLYFAGQVISLIGTWMQQMALSWLVYRMTNSPLMLGLVGFSTQIPTLLIAPYAGIVADRTNRHRLVLIIQALSMVQATALAILVSTGHAQLWQLLVLSAFLGCLTAFDLPTRQTFLVDMLDDQEQMASAIGINSSINTSTRLVGPFVAGLFVSWAGEAACFTVNAISYIAVIVALLFIKAKQPAASKTSKNGLAQLKEGISYTLNCEPIRDLILLLALFGLFGMPFAVLMPAFAKDVFHGSASTLGLLSGASGAGSLIGALFLTSRKGLNQLTNLVMAGCTICGLALIAFGASTNLPLSLLAVAIAGFGSMIFMAAGNTVIQTVVDKDKRGRVMSFVVMAFLGMSPFGYMAAGSLASVVGVGKTVMATGAFTIILALIFMTRILRIKSYVTPAEIRAGIAEEDLELTATSK